MTRAAASAADPSVCWGGEECRAHAVDWRARCLAAESELVGARRKLGYAHLLASRLLTASAAWRTRGVRVSGNVVYGRARNIMAALEPGAIRCDLCVEEDADDADWPDDCDDDGAAP